MRDWRWALLVLLVALGLYAPTLGFDFILEWDDAWLVLDNPYLRDPGLHELAGALDPTVPLAPWGYEYLPLRNASLLLDRTIWGFRPFGYHLTNLLLFGLTCLLFFALLRRLGLSDAAAAAGALAFAVHPLLTEPVAWVMGRRSCLALVFAALGGWCWLRRQDDRGWREGLLPALCLIAAASSKATALALPALYVALDLATARERPPSRRALLLPYLPVLLALGLAAGTHLWAGYRARLIGGMPYGQGAAASGAFFFYYCRLAVWPVDLVIPYPWSRRFLPAAPAPAAGLALVALWLLLGAGLTLRRWRRLRGPAGPDPLLAALVWWPAALLPALNLLLPIQRAFAARYAALASLALGLAVAGLAHAGRRRPRLAGSLLGVLITGLAVLSALRLPDWRNSRTLWESSVRRAPHNRMAWYKLGHSHDAQWRRTREAAARAEAIRCYRHAIALDPGFPDALNDLAVLLRHEGRDDEARELLERAVAQRPLLPVAAFNLAQLEARRGNVGRARELLRRTLELQPTLVEARRLLDRLEGR